MLLVVNAGWPWPNRTVRRILTLAGVLGILVTFGGRFDRQAGIGLLWIMASIKPMEIRNHRDVMVTVFLTYFLAAAILFFSNSLLVGWYMLFAVFSTTAVLIHVNHARGRWTDQLRLSARILLQALPLMIVLFVFFPRMQGGLWGVRSPADAVSGFADRLVPGAVSNLVRSNEIAFRVEFAGPIPEPQQLYWRGIVFWDFDGQAWLPRRFTGQALPLSGEKEVAYTVTIEPHGRRWLFALDLPYESTQGAFIRPDHTLVWWRKVRQRIRYGAGSLTDYNTGLLWKWELAALNIPPASNPKTVELAQAWRAAAAEPENVIRAAMRFFRENKFRYTLNPPLLGQNSIDQFLFHSRRGYCEHFASAFAFMMRAANIPARVVGGYLGGDLNPYGDYLIVRQAHAHAWVEVWLAEKGWVRVDPTAAVAPERVAQGVTAALPPEDRLVIRRLERFGQSFPYWNHVRLGWDALNTRWNDWVLGYSHTRQKSLMAKVGIRTGTWKGLTKLLLVGAGFISLFGLFYVYQALRTTRSNPDAVQRIYLVFCAKLARIGLARKPEQGPRDYAEAIGASRPDLRKKVRCIVDLYIRLRYGRGGDSTDLRRFKTLVKNFDSK
jgi:transglutaminase-like putative cysteine protease